MTTTKFNGRKYIWPKRIPQILKVIELIVRHGTTIPTSKIAEELGTSTAYVQQICLGMTRDGLLKSERGARGGFTLKGDPSEVTLGDVFAAVGIPEDRGDGVKAAQDLVFESASNVTLKEWINGFLPEDEQS